LEHCGYLYYGWVDVGGGNAAAFSGRRILRPHLNLTIIRQGRHGHVGDRGCLEDPCVWQPSQSLRRYELTLLSNEPALVRA